MSTFTIDPDNNITALVEVSADADKSTTFSTEKELAKLIADWPASRLIDAWNSFAGVAPFDDLKPIKKFTSRKIAVARIWAAVQRLSPTGAQQASDVAPTKGKSEKTPAKPTKRARAQKDATERTNKKAKVIAMMKRAKGATLVEIMEATGWQKHTVRGFVSILGSKGRREDRIVEERRWGAHLPHQVSKRRFVPSQRRSGFETLGGVSFFCHGWYQILWAIVHALKSCHAAYAGPYRGGTIPEEHRARRSQRSAKTLTA